MSKLCGGYAEENRTVLEDLIELRSKLHGGSEYVRELGTGDNSDNMNDVIEEIAIHANQLHLSEHEESLESLRLKSQINQISHSTTLCKDQIAQEEDSIAKEILIEERIQKSISELEKTKSCLAAEKSTVLQTLECQKVKLSDMRNLQEKTEKESHTMLQSLLELNIKMDKIKKEAQEDKEALAAQNAALRAKNEKLKKDMDQVSTKYQQDIQRYFDDMDQNKKFISLLRDKIRTLQDERNNFGDAATSASSPRSKTKKQKRQRPRTPRTQSPR